MVQEKSAKYSRKWFFLVFFLSDCILVCLNIRSKFVGVESSSWIQELVYITNESDAAELLKSPCWISSSICNSRDLRSVISSLIVRNGLSLSMSLPWNKERPTAFQDVNVALGGRWYMQMYQILVFWTRHAYGVSLVGDTRLPFRRVNNLCVTCAFAVLRHEEVLIPVRESKNVTTSVQSLLPYELCWNLICLLWLQFILIIEFAHHLYCLLSEQRRLHIIRGSARCTETVPH